MAVVGRGAETETGDESPAAILFAATHDKPEHAAQEENKPEIEKKTNQEKPHQGGWQHSYNLKQHLKSYSFSIEAPMTSIIIFVDKTLYIES